MACLVYGVGQKHAIAGARAPPPTHTHTNTHTHTHTHTHTGNDNKNLMSFSPAACDAAVSVTAVNPTNNQPASFSNWAAPSEAAAVLRRTVMGPGVNIVSTLPDGTYQAYSGTSMVRIQLERRGYCVSACQRAPCLGFQSILHSTPPS